MAGGNNAPRCPRCDHYDADFLGNRVVADFFGDGFDGLLVHARCYLGVEHREIEHDNVFRRLYLVARKRLRNRVAVFPVDDLEKLLAHHAVVLASERHPLLDLRTVDFDNNLVAHLAGEPTDVFVVEASAECLFDACNFLGRREIGS
jgi:hypothetical protein